MEKDGTPNYGTDRDLSEANPDSWKFTSLVWASLDGGLRPVEVGNARVGWCDAENAADQHAAGDFPRVEVDEFENITEVSDENPASSCSATETGTVPVERVYHLIADLVADGQTRTAHRVRRALLGADDALATNRDDPSHPGLFEALLSQGRTDRTDHQVTVALEGEGLMVACHGESALLTAEEAREIAARLEQVATSEDWRDGEVREFVAFLQYGADVLEGKKAERELREEFNYWR